VIRRNACGDEGADDRKVGCTGDATEAAGDFLLDLHHAGVAFGLIVGEGHGRIVEEAQNVLFSICETQEKIMSGSPGRLPGQSHIYQRLARGNPLRPIQTGLYLRDRSRGARQDRDVVGNFNTSFAGSGFHVAAVTLRDPQDRASIIGFEPISLLGPRWIARCAEAPVTIAANGREPELTDVSGHLFREWCDCHFRKPSPRRAEGLRRLNRDLHHSNDAQFVLGARAFVRAATCGSTVVGSAVTPIRDERSRRS
jgi:hypothetical protein